MSKPTPSSLKNIDFGEDWSQHPLVDWLANHKQIILWIFVGLLALLILIYQFMSMRTVHNEKDYYQAQTVFNQFQQADFSENPALESDLKQLETMMNTHPELKARYEGPLAQTLLVLGQVPQARLFAEGIFKRTQEEHLQLYQDYSKTSLLIGEGNYEAALQQAQQLQQTLAQLEPNAALPTLTVFNLIRLGVLYQQLGQQQEERQIWDQLQNATDYLEAVVAVNQALKAGQASLNQYIEERKQALIP